MKYQEVPRRTDMEASTGVKEDVKDVRVHRLRPYRTCAPKTKDSTLKITSTDWAPPAERDDRSGREEER